MNQQKAKLDSVKCPGCQATLESDWFFPEANGGAKRATTFESCFRKCRKCGIGVSNAKGSNLSKLSLIYLDPFCGVLNTQIRQHWEMVLKNAINKGNRTSKARKFHSSESEDHICWVVFRYLQIHKQLRRTVAQLNILDGLHPKGEEPALLLWGAAVPPDEKTANCLVARLEKVCDGLDEEENSRSEPDIILDFQDEGIVFIEAKHTSPNDENHKGKWGKYLPNTEAFTDTDGVRSTGLYELARNWRIAWEMAGSRPFTLVNLGPSKLFATPSGETLQRFRECLNTKTGGKFITTTWCELRAIIEQPEPWFCDYLRGRGV